MDYLALKAADAALGIADPVQAAAALNANTLNVAVDLPWSTIRDVLMNNFDWGSLVTISELNVGSTLPGGALQTFAIKSAASAIRECCLYGGTFASSNAAVWARLTTAAGLLTPANVGGISAASASAISAMRIAIKPHSGLSDTATSADVIAARTQF